MELRRPNNDRDTSLDYNDVKNATEWLGLGGGGSTVYAGASTSGGTGTLPTNWSISKSTGVYTITHNLGTANYSVAVALDDGSTGVITVAYNTNTFVVRTFNMSSSLEDRAFHFILTLY